MNHDIDRPDTLAETLANPIILGATVLGSAGAFTFVTVVVPQLLRQLIH